MFHRDRVAAELDEHPGRASSAPMPLEGIRIIDFSHFVAGPLATMLLADLGADVIKVEPVGRGDEFRRYPPTDPAMPLQSAPFIWVNRNKRSLAIDLKSAEGRGILRRLIESADVIVENFSTGVMGRLGFGYDQCKAENPRLVYCSISAYGRTGLHADRPGFDSLAQAESGFIMMNGDPEAGGVKAASPVMDIGCGLMASNAIQAALLARVRSGVGQAIDLSLFDSAMTMVGYASIQHLLGGTTDWRSGNTAMENSPAGIFHTADCSFIFNGANPAIFQRFFSEVLDRPDIGNDAALQDRENRIAQRERLEEIINTTMSGRPWSHWEPRLRMSRIPAGRIRSLAEALRGPEVKESGLITRIPHPDGGWIPNVALPFNFSDTPVRAPVAAPALGEHSRQILSEDLRFSEEEIDQLIARGLVGVG